METVQKIQLLKQKWAEINNIRRHFPTSGNHSAPKAPSEPMRILPQSPQSLHQFKVPLTRTVLNSSSRSRPKNMVSGHVTTSSPRRPVAMEKGFMGQSDTSALPGTTAAAEALSRPARAEAEAATRTRSESSATDTSALTMSSPNHDQGTSTPAFANIFGRNNKSTSEIAGSAHDGGEIEKSKQQEAFRKSPYMYDATILDTLEALRRLHSSDDAATPRD